MNPVEPSADIREGAHHLRQIYVALVSEGFTIDEALKIISFMLPGGKV